MNFKEFLTFCAIKGIVLSHREMYVNSVNQKPGFHVWKIELEASGYNAYIRYEDDNGTLSIMHTTLYDHSRPKLAYQDNVSLSYIQEKLLDF